WSQPGWRWPAWAFRPASEPECLRECLRLYKSRDRMKNAEPKLRIFVFKVLDLIGETSHGRITYKNVPRSEWLTVGVLYFNGLNRLPCSPVAQIQRRAIRGRVPFVAPLAQGNNHRKQIPAFFSQPVFEA